MLDAIAYTGWIIAITESLLIALVIYKLRGIVRPPPSLIKTRQGIVPASSSSSSSPVPAKTPTNRLNLLSPAVFTDDDDEEEQP
jgi:hypothetical protein